MTRKLHYLAVAAALLFPCSALAQSDSDDATASINVVATVAVTATGNLDFGTWPTGARVASSDVPARAAWSVALDASHDVQLSMVLPPWLTGTGGVNRVPLTYGLRSGRYAGTTNMLFDPATGTTITAADANFEVILGEDFNADGTGDVLADLTSAVADSYSGVITLTVTIM